MRPTKELSRLIDAAVAARENAYCPYSRYPVGAAVLSGAGKIFTGCNVENASFGLSLCAERAAVFNAVSQAHKTIKAVCVAARSPKPCGACRQVVYEFSTKESRFYLVDLDVNARSRRVREIAVHKLLPAAFDPFEAQLLHEHTKYQSTGRAQGRPRRRRRSARLAARGRRARTAAARRRRRM